MAAQHQNAVFPYRFVVKDNSRRHKGKTGIALKDTPHGVLVQLDITPANHEVLPKGDLKRTGSA